ncbi:autotransporter domain-containing protein [Agrobacterium sp. ES01]|uniref:autotransporter domain-containing protein n=1 Tax=Agrobacterium sp. ES01 TaxID=3420714 RepID=UPI003D0C9F06
MKNSWGAARRKGITLPSLYVTSALSLVLAAGMSQIAMAKDSSATGILVDDISAGDAAKYYGDILGMSDTGIVLFEYRGYNGDWYYVFYSLTDGFTDPGSDGTNWLSAISADGSTFVGADWEDGNPYTAVVWTAADGYTDIGTLGGSSSYAVDVSDDGSAVTGMSYNVSGAYHAFYWTAETGMVDIGSLTTGSSFANAISGDGSTVVGYSLSESGNSTAFRWDNVSQTIESLGTLGITNSYATLVSYDGSVVAGSSITTDNYSYTFRWTEEGGMTNIGTLGGTYTYVSAMSDDGGAIVGRSSTTSDSYFHAYRWFVSGDGITGTMSDLGTLGGGNTSAADDVSADGKVVVGAAWDSASVSHGFRWTDETGMISVDDWLRDAGVTLDTDITSGAKYVSADGNIVTGFTQDGLIYIAKVSVDEETDTDTDGDDDGSGSSGGDNSGSGIITYDDFLPTLYGVQVTSPALAQASTVMFGAQGSPMRNLLSLGQKSVWGTVDSGYDNGPSSDGGLALGDVGMGYGIADGVTARLSVGATYTRQDLDDGGEFRNRGYYVAPEVSALLGDNVYLTVGGYASRGSADVNRGYRNGTALDYSSGSTDTKTYGLKARLDWLDAASINGTAITPYAAISRAWSHADAYRESGGSFPVSYDAVDDHQTIIRLGSDFIHPLTNDFRLTFRAEADYRFEKRAADISGEIIDVSSFDLEGVQQKQLWLRGGIGGEYDVAGGTASLMLNVTTEGSDPDIWLRAGWQTKF